MYDDDDLDPSEYPDGDDLDDSCDDDEADGADRTCPACGQAVYYDAQQCPHCGEWIVAFVADRFGHRTPRWIVSMAGVIVTLVVLGLLLAVLR